MKNKGANIMHFMGWAHSDMPWKSENIKSPLYTLKERSLLNKNKTIEFNSRRLKKKGKKNHAVFVQIQVRFSNPVLAQTRLIETILYFVFLKGLLAIILLTDSSVK